MSVMLAPVAAVVGGLLLTWLYYMLRYGLGSFVATGAEFYTVFSISAVLCLLLYRVSPLPATNGGFGAPPARLEKWGFTSEPYYDDYEQPDIEDMLQCALGGVSIAERREDNE